MLTETEWAAVGLSLGVASLATLVSLPFGIALGYLLARYEFRGRSLVEVLLSLPLVLPPVVTGYLLLVLFGRRGWIGSGLLAWFGVSIVFAWPGAVLASAVMAFPLMVRAIRLAFASVDERLEQAARTLGASPVRVFLAISLPLAKRGVLAGAALAFARSLGEFGATILIAGNIPFQTQTLPLAIYALVNEPDGIERSSRLVVVAILLAFLTVALAEWLDRQGTSRGTPGHRP
jgi:molybdate transport system permease protein